MWVEEEMRGEEELAFEVVRVTVWLWLEGWVGMMIMERKVVKGRNRGAKDNGLPTSGFSSGVIASGGRRKTVLG